MWLKQSTAATITFGPFVDATDAVTPETPASLSAVAADIRLSKNGGAFAAKNDATNPASLENGHWSVVLNATDTDTLGRLRVACYKAGGLPVWADFMVIPAQVYNSIVAGSDQLDVSLPSADQILLIDALLKRDMSAVTGESSRSPLNALRKLMNKWSISGSTLTVFKEDDSTSAFTQAITTQAGADPITGLG